MSNIERFQQYAEAFEEVYKNDDWPLLEQYFTEDAVYQTAGASPEESLVEGRAAILAHLKTSVNQFDRRFDSRRVEFLEGPAEREGAVWFRCRASYELVGTAGVSIEGEELAWFEGDRIRRLEDRCAAEQTAGVGAFMEQHGSRLEPVQAG